MGISYDLAVKLKEVGFPQPPLRGAYDRDLQLSWYQAYIPTLSELISACGSDFMSISSGKGGWVAEQTVGLDGGVATGSTPEEAVANLYLSINTKQDAEN